MDIHSIPKSRTLDNQTPSIGGEHDAALGYIANIASPSADGDILPTQQWRTQRYKLQRTAGILMPDYRVSYCHCRTTAENATVKHSGEKSYYSGLMTCGSVWTCPVCSAKVNAQRMEEIRGGLATNPQYKLIPVTLTIQHRRGQSLTQLLNDLRGAKRALRSGKAWKMRAHAMGYVGTISALEIRWSPKTGWHPHLHELLVVRNDVDIAELHAWMTHKYGNWLADRGYLVNAHTVYISSVNRDYGETEIQEYLTKFSLELTVGHDKLSRGDSLSPFQLLAAYEETGQAVYADRFQEYARATFRRPQLTWTRGLKALLGVTDAPDEAIAAAEELTDETLLLAILGRDVMREVVRQHKRAALLNVADARDEVKLHFWLADNGLIGLDEVGDLLADVYRAWRVDHDHAANDGGRTIGRGDGGRAAALADRRLPDGLQRAPGGASSGVDPGGIRESSPGD